MPYNYQLLNESLSIETPWNTSWNHQYA